MIFMLFFLLPGVLYKFPDCKLCLFLLMYLQLVCVIFSSGENVEDAFLETAKKIYQNIQDGRCSIVCILSSIVLFLMKVFNY